MVTWQAIRQSQDEWAMTSMKQSEFLLFLFDLKGSCPSTLRPLHVVQRHEKTTTTRGAAPTTLLSTDRRPSDQDGPEKKAKEWTKLPFN